MKTRSDKQLHDGRCLVVAVVLLGFTVSGYAQTPGPEPIRKPDIRANIMKMLREGKEAGQEEDLFAEAERQQREKEEQVAPKEQVEPVMSTKQPSKEPPPKALAEPEGEAVQLPIKEILIKDVDDLEELARELQRAKKRQAGQ